MAQVGIIGAGLAGSEAALQLAAAGIGVTLFEMRPHVTSPAHEGSRCAELVCSNSFKSDDGATAAGLLKRELEHLGSKLLPFARRCSVDAGAALAVDRVRFSKLVTRAIENEPRIELRREEFVFSPDHGFDALIIAAGPLASERLTESLSPLLGTHLSFFDAAAPIISADSIDCAQAFFASRYGKGSGKDYLNCALDETQYRAFREALIQADKVVKRDFESKELFCACQPIEEVARTGEDAIRYGALKPVGIDDPRTGRWPYALVQLRAEDRNRQAYNLVGFQTNLTWPEQRRVFRMIPGLEDAEFLRYGVMHRNTFVDAPRLCEDDFSLKRHPYVWLAGQITGTEGYTEAIGSGLYVARNVAARLQGTEPLRLSDKTVLGALFAYATDEATMNYQPMHVNFGLIAPLENRVKNKRDRYAAYAKRSLDELVQMDITNGYLSA